MPVEFIDCSSLSINYNARGDVTLNFSVISDKVADALSEYNNLSFGGVRYTGWVTSVNISELEYTQVRQYQFTVLATAN